MNNTYVKIEGMDEFRQVIKDMPEETANEIEKELVKICLSLQGKAQLLAPVDKGDLRGSAYSEVNGLDGIVGFATDYALKQHEEMGYNHPKGGQAKYLEQPYKENVDKYIEALRNAIKKAVVK